MSSTTPTRVELSDPRLFRQAAYINGAWIDSGAANEVTEVDNPATGETLGVVPRLHTADTLAAIEAASNAFPKWRALTAKARAAVLKKWFELILANQEDLARLITLENGKPLAESKGEVAYGASFIEWFAEEGKRVYGDTIPSHAEDKRLFVLKEPVGVVACITPWNFPLAMVTRKAAPALAAGCTVVLKPAPQTPFSAMALAELAERAGVPPGVFNVVTGEASEIGAELTSNPIVRKLSFTGSTQVGKLLMSQCANTVKKLSLELGGNAPFIVFDDADIDAAVEGGIAAKYRNAGQTCVCTQRFLVQRSVYDEFAEKLTKAVSAMKTGNGLETGVVQGPLIEERAVQKVERHIADATAKGAKVLVGGQRHALGGRFFQPTVLADVTTAMQISEEETFGPVAPLFAFDTEAEAVALANATEFGLAAYFYGRDISRVWRVAEALEYGLVGINTGLVSTEVAPFGGFKESGLGREGSKYGIDEFVEIKYVCLGGINAPAKPR